MSKYTIYTTDEFGERYSTDVLRMTRNERKHADIIASIKAMEACDEIGRAAREDEQFELGLFPAVMLDKDGVTMGEYRPLCFGSIDIMNAEAVTNALVYTLKTLGLESVTDAMAYVNAALKVIEGDGAEEKALAREMATAAAPSAADDGEEA